MKHVCDAQKLGTNQSLDDGEAEEGKDDALCLKDGSFKIGEGGEADIKICRNNQEFLQLVGCSLPIETFSAASFMYRSTAGPFGEEGCFQCQAVAHALLLFATDAISSAECRYLFLDRH